MDGFFSMSEAKTSKKVSLRTVERLSVYRKVLEEFHQSAVTHVYSHELAKSAGITPAQLRKDLSIFGSFGNPSKGYDVAKLILTISELLGTNQVQSVALIGFGQLGKTLLTYGGFEARGFSVKVVFDHDPDEVGGVFAGRHCHHIDQLEEKLQEHSVEVAVLATRRTGLQKIVDRLAAAGVTGMLNFVPRTIVPPKGVFIEEVDFAAKFEKISFLIHSKNGKQSS